MRGFVRTVSGDVAPTALGVTNAHDHLLLSSPSIDGTPLTQEAAANHEAQAFRAAGGQAIVQWTPPGMGRRADTLRRIAEQAGIHLVAATGLHQARHYVPDGGVPRWPATLSGPELTALFIDELTQGMHGDDGSAARPDPARAGVIKVGAGYYGMDAQELRSLAAAGAAHLATGAPVCVHLEQGTHGPAVLQTLADAGTRPGRVVLGHLARNPDAQLHIELAAAGAFLAYDGPARRSHPTDWRLADLVAAMFDAGYGDRVMLGADTLTVETGAGSGGGPGAAGLLLDTAARLTTRIGEQGVHAVLVDNPARAFAWST